MSNPLPLLNGDKTGVGDFSTDASANMVAAIRDHISCTKPVQVDTFVTQDTKSGIIYPCDFDHMYASLAEGTVVERENLEVKHLKDLLLLHLDLIQQQSEQLVTKERQIASLRQENETLRQRLERMDRRVNLHKQRDGLTPTCEAASVPVAAPVDHTAPLQQLDSSYLIPKADSAMLSAMPTLTTAPTPVMLASLSASPQQFYNPAVPFQGRFEPFDDMRQLPPLPTFVQPPPMQLCEFPETDGRVPATSFAPGVLATDNIPTATTYTTPTLTDHTITPITDHTMTSVTDPTIPITTNTMPPITSHAMPPITTHTMPPITTHTMPPISTNAMPSVTSEAVAPAVSSPTTPMHTTTNHSTSECDTEPAKRRKTDELESPVQPLPAAPSGTPVTDRVTSSAQDSSGKSVHEEREDSSETDIQPQTGRGTPAWMSYGGRRRRRRPIVRHGRSNEGESSVVTTATDGSGGAPHLTHGLVRRGRRLLRNRYSSRKSGRRSVRRRTRDAAKDVLSTDHPYWTTVGELATALRLQDGLRSECTNVEVPSWRHKVYTSCYAMEGTENLDDEVFGKRHQRYESDERRRKRWDVQRIREQRHIEKLRQQQAARSNQANTSSNRDDCPLASLWPLPEDVTYIEVGEKLPVAAFGAPVVNFLPNEFSLPWKWRTALQEKVLRRSHHGSHTGPDGGHEAVSSSGGRR